jgi:hypothetical protein
VKKWGLLARGSNKIQLREHFNIYTEATEATEAQRTTETTRRKRMRIEGFESWGRDFWEWDMRVTRVLKQPLRGMGQGESI